MKKLAIILLLLASPAWAQSKPVGAHRADPCAPIGQTADGKLVYSMLCKNLPAPSPAPRADANAAPAEAAAAEPPPEEDKGGLFKFRAGAGIVADSNPLQELAETRAKAEGLLRALDARR